MTGEAFVEGDKNDKRRPYTLRKLCSNIEEYEALPRERINIDFDLLARRLEEAGFMDVVVQGPQLTILMEEIGVVARAYSDGTLHLQASLREDCERACDMIFAIAMAENGQVARIHGKNHFK